jgi:transcriptional regulator with XRE-family HTH domain
MVALEGQEVDFRERLWRQRKEAKLSQEELSNLLIEMGVRTYPTAIAKIEGGMRPARIDELRALADFFGCSIDALVGHTATKPQRNTAFYRRELAHEVSQWRGTEDARERLRRRIDDYARVDLDADGRRELASAEALYETLGPVSSQAESAQMAFLLDETPRSAEEEDAMERNLEAQGEAHNKSRKAKGDNKK